MTLVSTVVHGDPGACRAAATTLHRAASLLKDAARTTRTAAEATPAWHGRARLAFVAQTRSQERDLQTRATLLDLVAAALDQFARDLEAVQTDLAAARAAASASGCRVTPTGISFGATGAAIASAVSAARERESSAHATLCSALDRSRGESSLENLFEDLGLARPDNGDGLDLASWGYGLTSLAAGVAADLHLERIGLSAPPAASRASAEARALQAAAREASRANLVAKVTGPVGKVLTVGFSAKGQWDADEDDLSLNKADRVGRSAVRAGLEGGAAIAGGIAGGEMGGAIGTMICPGVGTVVGGVVGGAVGSFAATKAGQATADAAVEAVDDVIDGAEEVGDAVGEAAGAVADAGDAALDTAADVKDAAVDKAKDVGKKLCFWD
jgi:uncharacterized protein YukE